ncbi:MAG: hypothetical protein WCF45_10545 [Photobacterium halotolerans]
MSITLEQVQARFNEMVDGTTIYNELVFSSVPDAMATFVKNTHSNLSEFTLLTQEIIDEQSDNYDGYLDGAEVGDLVLGTDDCWVSQLTVERWRFESSSVLGKSYNRIDEIAEFIENDLALDYLSAHNDKEQ